MPPVPQPKPVRLKDVHDKVVYTVSIRDRHPPDPCGGIRTDYRRDVPAEIYTKINYILVYIMLFDILVLKPSPLGYLSE